MTLYVAAFLRDVSPLTFLSLLQGLARIKNSTRSMIRSLVGTVNWQAPELWVPHPRYVRPLRPWSSPATLTATPQNEKVDNYSAGMVYWEVLQWHQQVKRYPFEGSSQSPSQLQLADIVSEALTWPF